MTKDNTKIDLSPNQRAWKRLKRNKLAIFGLIVIIFSALIAILGYLITPDSTPNANDQVNQIALKGPGFKIQMLKVRKNKAIEKQGILTTMLWGKPNPYEMVPINNYTIKGDSIQVAIYQGEDRQGKEKWYHLANVVHPISISDPIIENQGNAYAFYPIPRAFEKETLSSLVQKIEEGHIIEKTYVEGTDTIGRAKIQDVESDNLDQLSFVDLANKPVGFKINFLKINSNDEEGKIEYEPFDTKEIIADSIFLQLNVTDTSGTKTLQKAYNLADVVHALPPNDPSVYFADSTQTSLTFFKADQPKSSFDKAALLKTIEKNHLITKRYLFGTDGFGRCLLSRLMIGVRISLSVGLIAVFISLTIGIFLGAVAGYFGGKLDDLIMLIINTAWSIPTLLLVFALVMALGRGYWQIFTAVGLTMWVDVARIVRGQVKGIKNMQYVEAAEGFGFGSSRIIRKHILPNIIGPVMVIAAVNFAFAILIEAGLSYLGFGIQPPQPSWGTMLSENYSFLMMSDNAFPALVPAIAIMLMVLAFNLLGNGMRDALDVRARPSE